MRYLTACCTDIGKKRAINQDSLLLCSTSFLGNQIVLAAVCDGMGGLEKGELASAEVIRAFAVWFENNLPELLEQGIDETTLYSSWEKLIQNVHQKIYSYGKTHDFRLGTTVTVLLFGGKEYYVAHVGDTRIYEINNQVSQITRDQTAFVLEGGTKSTLLQCIGASNVVKPVYYSGSIRDETVYLICSDGFWHRLGDKAIQEMFSPKIMADERTMLERADRAVSNVIRQGEKDNISVILIHVTKDSDNKKSGYKERKWGGFGKYLKSSKKLQENDKEKKELIIHTSEKI